MVVELIISSARFYLFFSIEASKFSLSHYFVRNATKYSSPLPSPSSIINERYLCNDFYYLLRFYFNLSLTTTIYSIHITIYMVGLLTFVSGLCTIFSRLGW